MAFDFLSKDLLRRESINKIVHRMDKYGTIFVYNQLDALDMITLINLGTILILRDYDSITKKVFAYENDFTEDGVIVERRGWNSGSVIDKEYLHVVPIIKYSEIRDSSEVIEQNSETEELTIRYGRGFSGSLDSIELNQRDIIKKRMLIDGLVETGRKITMFLPADETKKQLRVFRNEKTGEEFVFMNRKSGEKIADYIDDSYNPNAPFIGIVAPLTWTVDLNTGLAICNRPLFVAQREACPYEESIIAQFLHSPEFIDELDVVPTKSEKEATTSKNPFGKSAKLNLEEKIKRVLLGGTRIPYLVGHPGIGKTQVAMSISPYCLCFNMSTFTPDAFTGKQMLIPGDKIISHEGDRTIEHNEKGTSANAEPDWHVKIVKLAKECQVRNERCIMLLDEFDKLTPNMQILINGLAHNPRTIADWPIPENVDIIVAGNSEEYSQASFPITGEVASRLTVLDVTTDAIDWLKWATKHRVDPIVRAYIHNFPDKIIEDAMDKNDDYNQAISLTPRSWDQKISRELIECRKIGEQPFLEPYMNSSSLKHFKEFINLYFELGIEDILQGHFNMDEIDLSGERILVIINCLVAAAVTEEEICNSLKFIKQYNLSEYQALFERRWIDINNTDEDILRLKLAKSSLSDTVKPKANSGI